jgi:proteasome component ECM29
MKRFFQQYTGKILAAFVFGLTDRNPAIRKMYAISIGHLLKTAKESSVEKLFAKMKSWFTEKDDDATRMAVALTFQVRHT